MPSTPTALTLSSPRPASELSRHRSRHRRANAICERWIATARRECTDRILIAGRRHLHHILSEYVDHYNTHRPRRTLSQQPPDGRTHLAPPGDNIRIRRRDRLGGLIHEYSQVA